MVAVTHGRAERLPEEEVNDILWEIAADILGPAYRAAYERLYSLKEDVRVQYTPPFRHKRRPIPCP
jgi:hypothetical protein